MEFGGPYNHSAVKRKIPEPVIKDEAVQDSTISNQVVMLDNTAVQPGPQRKKQKKNVLRTPLMLLNEEFAGPQQLMEFKVESESGPSHDRVFVMSAVVNGVKHEAEGKSKKLAKQVIAENILRTHGMWPVLSSADDASFDVPDASFVSQPVANKKQNPTEALVQDIREGKNTVMIVKRYHPEATFTVVDGGGKPHDKVYNCELVLKGDKFVSSGNGKKAASFAAAKKALLHLYGESHSTNNSDLTEEDQTYLMPQSLADSIGEMVLQKFTELSSNCQITDVKRKVLAGIVKTVRKGTELSEMSVISLGTGTKCISGGYISDSGLALNDCHGEIIARRAFCHHLYDQLELCLKGKTKLSCFQKKKNGLFGLKEGVDFHLYISTSPCGDARIFSPQETQSTGTSDRHPQRKTRGLLRTKIENGEGTLPIKVQGVTQTFDGVLQGERLLTMSCSDKISKWNVAGMQGALLSHFIEPVYLESVILGSFYNFHHLTRALYKRLDDLDDLPPQYKLNRHVVNAISSPESRATGKSPSYSMNWTIGDEKLECVDAVKGKMENNQASRLCKDAFFRKFLALWKRLRRNVAEPSSYHEGKYSAQVYQSSVLAMKNAYQSRNLGTWVSKPCEQDDF